MKIVIAPDSFKGSLSARQAAEAIKTGLKAVWPGAEYFLYPLADGGEGTVETLVDLAGGQLFEETVDDPLLRKVKAHWGLLSDGVTAVVESAQGSGLARLTLRERDAAVTSSVGTGQLIAKALAHPGLKRLIVGLGGTAFNDAGSGLFSALGVKFLDDRGERLRPGGLDLSRLKTIDITGLNPVLSEIEIIVASDVKNPLNGPNGASFVFGPQKGADAEMVLRLDKALGCFAEIAASQLNRDVANNPGAGAAGGLGAGFMVFTQAIFRSGVEVVLEVGGFENLVAGANMVITGEGCTDGQTAWGKAPAGVNAVAKKHGIPAIIICGSVGAGYEKLYELGVAGIVPMAPGPISLEEVMGRASYYLSQAAERTAHLVKSFSSMSGD
jgi:glycerate kinase